MEIIFALMLLGATPVGAAMLNKPTRNRFVKYLQVHIVNPAKGITGDADDPELETVKKRSAEYWKADGALAELWQEAFNWWVIPNRENVLESALEKHKMWRSGRDPLEQELEELQKEYDEDGYYSNWSYEHFSKQQSKYNDLLDEIDMAYGNSLSPEEKFALELDKKHKKEIHYGNDLIRISAQENLPALDFIALTRYTSN